MRLLVFSGAAALYLFFVPSKIDAADTCISRAQSCVQKWGNPRAACYEAFRLEACARTGRYVAPNGNIWPATRVVKDTDS